MITDETLKKEAEAEIAPKLDPAVEARIDAVLNAANETIPDLRRKRIRRAIALGASNAILTVLCRATQVAEDSTIVLDRGRYEGCSRGRGWCRSLGQGRTQWGEKVKEGYVVGPGRWEIGSSDGFKRKEATPWHVQHVQVVPGVIWTIAD